MSYVTFDYLIARVPVALVASNLNWTAELPALIRRAELRVLRGCNPDLLKQKLTGTLGAASRVIDLSSTATYPYFKALRELWLDVPGTSATPPSRRVLLPRSHDYLTALYGNDLATSLPRFYCEAEIKRFELYPFPDAAYAWSAFANLEAVPLSPSNQTNLFTAELPQVLEQAAILEGAMWMKDTAAVQIWQEQLDRSLGDTGVEIARKRRDETTVRPRQTDNVTGT
jgi:hypothetical protein